MSRQTKENSDQKRRAKRKEKIRQNKTREQSEEIDVKQKRLKNNGDKQFKMKFS